MVESLAPLPAGTPLASSPFTVRATFAATGLQPTALESPLDVVVAAPAAELGATPVTGLVAYSLDGDGAWTLLPTWVDREEGALHILVPGNTTVAVSALTPRTRTLQPGWNLVTSVGAPNTPVSLLFAGLESVVDAIHHWDGLERRFESAFPYAPTWSTLHDGQPRDALWVHVPGDSGIEWTQFGGPLPLAPVALQPGGNLVSWIGEETPFTTGAGQLCGAAPAVFRWNTEAVTYDAFNAAGPTMFNTLTRLNPFDGLWVLIASDEPVLWDHPGLPAIVP